MTPKLVQLYQEMSDLTAPLCAGKAPGGCRAPHSCCDHIYCEQAIEVAAEDGVVLPRTEHPTLPLMGNSGCTAPPHYRPICTVHVCCICSLGFNTADPKWTEKYFQLRGKIEELDFLDV